MLGSKTQSKHYSQQNMSATEAMNTQPVEVTPIEDQKATQNKTVPKNLFNGFSQVLHEQQLALAKQVAEQFGLDLKDIIEKCLPDAPEFKATKSTKTKSKKKEKITDYKDATEKNDLKVFKIPELKEILEENGLPVSGSKPKLMDRVWGILHPDEAPKETPKKRGRKKKTASASDVSTLDIEADASSQNSGSSESSECEMDPSTMPNFFVKDGAKVDEDGDGVTTLKIFKKKWLFQEGEDELEFKGVVNKDGIEWTDEVPDELIKLLGMDD